MTLQSLRQLYDDLSGIEAEIFILDNASSDGSVAAIMETFPRVNIITNNCNAGFGAANNQGMRLSKGMYLLLLNSDAFIKRGAIGIMLNYMNKHPEVGVLGPRLINTDGTPQRSCWRFPTPLQAWLEVFGLSRLFPNDHPLGNYYLWRHDRERLVDFVIGACMLVRRIAYEDAGGFDEGFFMYSEEADWQRRITDKGWRIAFTPNAEVVHIGMGSAQTALTQREEHFFRSLDYYQIKHHGRAGLILFRMAMVTGCFFRIILWPLYNSLSKSGKKDRPGIIFLCRLFIRQLTNWKIIFKNKVNR